MVMFDVYYRHYRNGFGSRLPPFPESSFSPQPTYTRKVRDELRVRLQGLALLQPAQSRH